MIKEIIRIATVCKKCGIELCEKNESYNTKVTGQKYRRTTCKTCTFDTRVCRISYEDPLLDALSIKQRKFLQHKIDFARNPEWIAERSRLSYYKHKEERLAYNKAKQKEERLTLDDQYIKKLLAHSKNALFSSYNQLTPEIIEIKKKQIEVFRKLTSRV